MGLVKELQMLEVFGSKSVEEVEERKENEGI
jgi:hypothetical protein